jgi:hypothetical protein
MDAIKKAEDLKSNFRFRFDGHKDYLQSTKDCLKAFNDLSELACRSLRDEKNAKNAQFNHSVKKARKDREALISKQHELFNNCIRFQNICRRKKDLEEYEAIYKEGFFNNFLDQLSFCYGGRPGYLGPSLLLIVTGSFLAFCGWSVLFWGLLFLSCEVNDVSVIVTLIGLALLAVSLMSVTIFTLYTRYCINHDCVSVEDDYRDSFENVKNMNPVDDNCKNSINIKKTRPQ